MNEGFARFFEFIVFDAVRPEFKVWDSYYDKVIRRGISKDSKVFNTHPLEFRDISVSVNDAFDKISYNKGSAVLRMI